jgi:hypothetical protein
MIAISGYRIIKMLGEDGISSLYKGETVTGQRCYLFKVLKTARSSPFHLAQLQWEYKMEREIGRAHV